MHRVAVKTVETRTAEQQTYSAVPLACDAFEVPRLEGRVKRGLKVPKDMSDVHLLLWFLGQHISAAAHKTERLANPAKINYFKCFQLFDMDGSSGISRDEFAKTVRRTLGVTSDEISHGALDVIFKEMDDDGSGVISVKEFSAYMRGASNAMQARAAAAPGEVIPALSSSVRRASLSLSRATPKSGRKSVHGRSDREMRLTVNNRTNMKRGGPPVAVVRKEQPKQKQPPQPQATPTSWLDDVKRQVKKKAQPAPKRHVTQAAASVDCLKRELRDFHVRNDHDAGAAATDAPPALPT